MNKAVLYCKQTAVSIPGHIFPGISEGVFILEPVFYLRLSGLAGVLVLVFSCIFAALGYEGRRGELYSPFNHFISELGEVGVSPRARAFNAGLVAGGLLLGFFLVGTGLFIGTAWGVLSAVVGAAASLSCVMVGIHSMDDIWPHVRAAVSYFLCGAAAAVLFTLGIWLQPEARVAKSIVIPGILAILAYAALLGLSFIKQARGKLMQELIPGENEEWERPVWWTITVLEWAVFICTLIWCFWLALGI